MKSRRLLGGTEIGDLEWHWTS